MCCTRKWTEQIGLLTAAGADPDSDAGSSALCVYFMHGRHRDNGTAEVKGRLLHCEGYTPLMTASDFGQLEAAKWLIQQGANVPAAALLLNQWGRLVGL